jgi:predicted amidohydrolase YtcJ
LGLENGEHTSGAPSACQRDPQGRLSGLVIEGDGLLRARGLPRLDDAALARAVADASNELATHGVTWLCDAGAENDNATRALFMRLAAAGCILQRWALLQGIQAFLSEGGDLSDAFVGVKLVVSSSSGAPEPDVEELTRQLEAVHAAGVPAAVHAVEPDELVVALSAFESVFARRGRGAIRHRIEHASACPPDLAAWIARLRLVVVTQPAFVAAFGDRYLERAHVPPEWLYPCRALRAAGIPVAASSDAPFGPCAPLAAVRAASRRRSQTGHGVGLGQRLGLDAAFSLYATSAVASESGRLHLGGPADIVVLDREPLVDGVGGTSDELVQTTIAAGRIVFERV